MLTLGSHLSQDVRCSQSLRPCAVIVVLRQRQRTQPQGKFWWWLRRGRCTPLVSACGQCHMPMLVVLVARTLLLLVLVEHLNRVARLLCFGVGPSCQVASPHLLRWPNSRMAWCTALTAGCLSLALLRFQVFVPAQALVPQRAHRAGPGPQPLA